MKLKEIKFDITKIKPDAEKPQQWVKFRNGESCRIVCVTANEREPIISLCENGSHASHSKNGSLVLGRTSQWDLLMFAPDLVGHLPKPPDGQEYHVPEGWEGDLPEIPSGYRLMYESEKDRQFHVGSKFYCDGTFKFMAEKSGAAHSEELIIVIPDEQKFDNLGLYRFFLDNGKLKMEEVEG